MRKRLKKFEDIVTALQDCDTKVHDDSGTNFTYNGKGKLIGYSKDTQFWIDEKDYNRLFKKKKKKSKWIKCDPNNIPDLKVGEYKIRWNVGNIEIGKTEPSNLYDQWGWPIPMVKVYITHYKPIKKRKKKADVIKFKCKPEDLNETNKPRGEIKTTPKISDFVRAGYAKNNMGYIYSFSIRKIEDGFHYFIDGYKKDKDTVIEYYTPITADELANMIDKGE